MVGQRGSTPVSVFVCVVTSTCQHLPFPFLQRCSVLACLPLWLCVFASQCSWDERGHERVYERGYEVGDVRGHERGYVGVYEGRVLGHWHGPRRCRL